MGHGGDFGSQLGLLRFRSRTGDFWIIESGGPGSALQNLRVLGDQRMSLRAQRNARRMTPEATCGRIAMAPIEVGVTKKAF
jgi:hypothetical protein